MYKWFFVATVMILFGSLTFRIQLSARYSVAVKASYRVPLLSVTTYVAVPILLCLNVSGLSPLRSALTAALVLFFTAIKAKISAGSSFCFTDRTSSSSAVLCDSMI